jgi:replicative DNA helicase
MSSRMALTAETATLLADERLRPEHFYREAHEAVFAAMLALHEQGSAIDHLTVAEMLRQHGNSTRSAGSA